MSLSLACDRVPDSGSIPSIGKQLETEKCQARQGLVWSVGYALWGHDAHTSSGRAKPVSLHTNQNSNVQPVARQLKTLDSFCQPKKENGLLLLPSLYPAAIGNEDQLLHHLFSGVVTYRWFSEDIPLGNITSRQQTLL